MTEIYRNLHKNTFSVRRKGKVIDHQDVVVLKDCRFVVQPAGLQKVRQTGRKNVHAFIRGELLGSGSLSFAKKLKMYAMRQAYYNPYEYASFVDKRTSQPITDSRMVVAIYPEVWYLP